jgi:putative ABC transport system permease protein
MSPWRSLWRGLRALNDGRATDADLSDEVQHFLHEAIDANIARGMSPRDAERAARLEVGNLTGVREQVRSFGWENTVETLVADVRFALRRLRAEPGFTAVTLLTLALGIGGTTAIFSAVKPILFEALPYPRPDRIVAIWEVPTTAAQRSGRLEGSFGMFKALGERSASFASIAQYRSWQPTMTGAEQPERFEAQRVGASYFSTLGVVPAVGRDFNPADDRMGAPNVTILSDNLWRRRFAADPTIVGREIVLDDTRWTVIGVMPPGFDNVLAPRAELWAPMQYDLSQGRAWGHHVRGIGRLRGAVDIDLATRELNTIGATVLAEQQPATYGESVAFQATPLHDDVTRGVSDALLAILAAMVLVLVIACVNVSNLVLARGVHRRAEFALRAALGASHGRLSRQLLTESLLLAVIGGALGMVVAVGGVRALVALSPSDLPRVAAMGVDGGVFVFGLVLSTVIGVTFGLMPARQAARTDPQRALQRASKRTAGGHRRVRGVLVVAEVAIALVLLVSSGLLLRSMQRLLAVDSGFDAANVLTMQVHTSGRRFANDTVTKRFFAQALDAVRRVPGVESAAFTSQLPLSGDIPDVYGLRFEAAEPIDGEDRGAYRYGVVGSYVETMRIPLRRGRPLTDEDRVDAPLVALVNVSYAKRHFGDKDPVGELLRVGPVQEPITIVGVVGDVKQESLALTQSDAVYLPISQWPFADRVMSLVVRLSDPGRGLAGGGRSTMAAEAIRQAIWSVDKDQPIVRVATMDELVARSAAERRFALVLFELFALAALVLAAAGIYGVLAGSVAERTREIGVRAALGASRASIVGMVLRHGLSLTGMGIAIGLVGAIAATRAIATMLFGVTRLDPTTYAGVVALLAAVALLACCLPAWRAARLDPARTLRAD